MALEVPYRSIPDMFLRRVAATPDHQAFARPTADDAGLDWLTWSQVGEQAESSLHRPARGRAAGGARRGVRAAG